VNNHKKGSIKMKKEINIEAIAKVAHEINAAFCLAYNDNSQTSWDEAPEWQRESAINGVNFHIKKPRC
jgi:hypothetical protein